MDNEIDVDKEIDEDEAQHLLDLPWINHPARSFLLKNLQDGTIPVDKKKMGPRVVWDSFCKDNSFFERMEYDDAFRRRLLDLRKHVEEGKSRADDDIKAFDIAKANHPVPQLNCRGEPQWNGSEAQKQLKEDMTNNLHYDMKPEHLWQKREVYQQFNLTTFREHLHQAHKTSKYYHTLKVREEEEQKKQVETIKKRKEAEEEKKKLAKVREDALAGIAEMTQEGLGKQTVPILKQLCIGRGLKASGKKVDLIGRILQHEATINVAKEEEANEPEEEEAKAQAEGVNVEALI